jgi:hypothetical protein
MLKQPAAGQRLGAVPYSDSCSSQGDRRCIWSSLGSANAAFGCRSNVVHAIVGVEV